MTTLVTSRQEADHSLITLDDGKANALGFEMLAQFDTALSEAQQADKVVIITGRPGIFSAGFDLAVITQGGDAMTDLLCLGGNVSRRLLNFPTPVVLAVSGHALAMGALLLLSADYRVGALGAYKIGLNEVAIGMTMPRFGVELARARLANAHLGNALSLATVYDVEGAVKTGYLDEAVGAEDLLPRVTAMARQLSALDMEAYRQTKTRVREHLNAALDDALTSDRD